MIATSKEIINMNLEPAPTTVRRLNSRAITRRSRWRTQYNILQDLIRDAKQNVRANPECARAKMMLRSLQMNAQIMMVDREWITDDLESTAYPWVEVAA
jgi:hypothetical protein